MASYGPAMPPAHSSRKSPVDEDDNDDGDLVGPALPPHLLGKTIAGSGDEDSDGNDEIGPALPPHLQPKTTKKVAKEKDDETEFGVQLPPDYSRWNTFDVDASDDDFGENDDEDTKDDTAGVQEKQNEEVNDDDDDDDDAYGPALPPSYKKHQPTDNAETSASLNVRNYGPSLPPGLHSNRMPVELAEDDESDDEEEDEMIGPMPLKPGSEGLYSSSTAVEFEKRAAAMKEKIANKDRPEQPKRETWMMELPGYSTNFGLGSRTFRKTARPEDTDRSEWTDTPADKARREKERAEKRRIEQSQERAGKSRKKEAGTELSQRDKKLADMVAKHNETKRAESLVDMHSKDRKRILEEDGEKPVERRPFDRDLDLNVNQFDEAKRKLLIKKSAQLNTKFSHGKDKVYL